MRAFILIVAFAIAASAHAASDHLAEAWPNAQYAEVGDIGEGIAVVFSPDLSVPGNCRFYTALGFACFENADWSEILRDIRTHNIAHPSSMIRTLILETHGTNGNGLKVQTGKNAKDPRSYISVGALQERVEPDGVRYIIISACNSGRLLRPQIYRKLDRNTGDKLFLPATRGIIDATASWDPARSRVTVLTPAESHIETTLVGHLRELAPSTRDAIAAVAEERGIELPNQFAISDMLIRMLVREPDLELRTGAHVEEFSPKVDSQEESERRFRALIQHLEATARRSLAEPVASK
ncbi:MAG TPA: hypothetical protein VF618_19435 [Thermoanaerobaculia bacterium]